MYDIPEEANDMDNKNNGIEFEESKPKSDPGMQLCKLLKKTRNFIQLYPQMRFRQTWNVL